MMIKSGKPAFLAGAGFARVIDRKIRMGCPAAMPSMAHPARAARHIRLAGSQANMHLNPSTTDCTNACLEEVNYPTFFNICRNQLISTARAWERHFSVAPSITSALSEFDAAMLIGMTAEEYSASMIGRSAVGKGHDFVHSGVRYQVKANRPSYDCTEGIKLFVG